MRATGRAHGALLQVQYRGDASPLVRQHIECPRSRRRIHNLEANAHACERKRQLARRKDICLARAEQDDFRTCREYAVEMFGHELIDVRRFPGSDHFLGGQRDRLGVGFLIDANGVARHAADDEPGRQFSCEFQ